MEWNDNVQIKHVYKSNHPVGIVAKDNLITLYVPSFFRDEKDEGQLKSDLLLFLASISIAKKDYKSINSGKDEGPYWPFESYLWLIKDYINNGIYYNREKQYSDKYNGKIHWKKTLRNVPMISNGNVIYDKLVASKTNSTNDVISHTYKYCLKKSIDRIGWLVKFEEKMMIQPLYSKLEMIYYVKKELSSTFDDIKRLRFKHMLAILESIDDDTFVSSNFNYLIENYYYVFEKMVDDLLFGIKGERKKKYYPFGKWKLLDLDEFLSSNLRPDTIFIKSINEDRVTYIIDAKMYQYGFTRNIRDLPETSSMQKQITYGDFIKNYVDSLTKIRNVFILPYNKMLPAFCFDTNNEKKRVLEDDLIYIGEASVNWRDNHRPEDYDRIFIFLIDFNYLLRSYRKRDSLCINNLTDKVESLLNNKGAVTNK